MQSMYIFFILAFICFTIFAVVCYGIKPESNLSEKENSLFKKIFKRPYDENVHAYIVFCSFVLSIVLVICGIVASIRSVYEPYNPNAGGVKCEICGGAMKCEICGESGLHCENAQFGSGTDHYCGEHWADVVEWHNK